MVETARPRTRDAERSRSAILDAAERLLSERGYGSTSLAEVAKAAQVSRATPSYFFGSKAGLYAAVLERVFAARDEATREAFAPVLVWVSGSSGPDALRRALRSAVSDYVAFLHERDSFVHLIQREELEGRTGLAEMLRAPSPMVEVFDAVRAAGPRRGIRPFRVGDVVVVLVSLVFTPLTQATTFMASLGRDLDEPQARQHHVDLVVSQLMALIEQQASA